MAVTPHKVVQGRNKGDNHAEVKGGIPMRIFAETDKAFINACGEADIKPTARQASKWRNKRGLAYKTKHGKI